MPCSRLEKSRSARTRRGPPTEGCRPRLAGVRWADPGGGRGRATIGCRRHAAAATPAGAATSQRVASEGAALHAAPLPGDPAPLPLRRPAPNAVLNPVVKRIFQTRCLYRAIRTNAASDFDPHAVAGEERLGSQLPALPLSHPAGVQFLSTSVGSSVTRRYRTTSKSKKEPQERATAPSLYVDTRPCGSHNSSTAFFSPVGDHSSCHDAGSYENSTA